MKKILSSIIGSGVLMLLLSGCGGSEESSNKAVEKKDPPKQAEQKKVENPKTDEEGNVILDQVGQKTKDASATAELMKIKKVNEVVNIAPIKATVHDIKVIKLTDLSDDMKQQIEYMTDKKAIEPVYYIQISLTAENTSDKNIAWNSLHRVVTDKGEQLDPNQSILMSNFDTEFLGKVTQEDFYGMVLGKGKEDIHKVKLVFNSSADNDTYEDITPEQQVEYTLD